MPDTNEQGDSDLYPRDTSLDPSGPDEWDEYRRVCHAALDDAIDALKGKRDGPVWRAVPDEVERALDEPLPRAGMGDNELRVMVRELIGPYGVGNTDPRFWGWVHGSGTAQSMVSEIWRAAMNVNAGGRDHIGTRLERRVMAWCRELLGIPHGAGGVLCSGTSTATLICLKVARDRALADGSDAGSLVVYESGGAHACIGKACDVLGIRQVRSVGVDGDGRMDPHDLRTAIERDLAEGLRGVAVCATVGTVNTGAVDPVPAVADVCEALGVWLHVDAAFGIGTALSDGLRYHMDGVDRADSVAFDFHKWLHAPYAVGGAVLRDGDEHARAFGMPAAYLEKAEHGLAAGRPWACDLGIELSRPFYALGVWYTLKRFGVERLGAQVERNCAQARLLGALVEDEERLELLAPVSLNIVCLRHTGPDELNAAIVAELHERGLFAPSLTTVCGRRAIRVCLTNHRTRDADLRGFTRAIVALGAELGG